MRISDWSSDVCSSDLSCGSALAQGFSALVSPPRFEDSAKAGENYRNVIEITNVSAGAAHFTVQTADWIFDPDATDDFYDALAPGSCRPGGGLEAASGRTWGRERGGKSG